MPLPTFDHQQVVLSAAFGITDGEPNEFIYIADTAGMFRGSRTPVAEALYFYDLNTTSSANYGTTTQKFDLDRAGDVVLDGWAAVSHPGIAAYNTTAISSAYYPVGRVATAVTNLLRPSFKEYAPALSITKAELKLSNMVLRRQKALTSIMREECDPVNPNYPQRELMGAYRSRAAAQDAACKPGTWFVPLRNVFFEGSAFLEPHFQVYTCRLECTLAAAELTAAHMTAATIAGASLVAGGTGTPAIDIRVAPAADSKRSSMADWGTASLPSAPAGSDFGFGLVLRHGLFSKGVREGLLSDQEMIFDELEVYEGDPVSLSLNDNWQSIGGQLRPNAAASGVILMAYSSVSNADQASGATGNAARHQDGNDSTYGRALLKGLQMHFGSNKAFEHLQDGNDSGVLQLLNSNALPVKPYLEYHAISAGPGSAFEKSHRFPLANIDFVEHKVKVSDYAQANSAAVGTVSVVPFHVQNPEFKIMGANIQRLSMLD